MTKRQQEITTRSKNPGYAYEAGRCHCARVLGFCTMTCSRLDQCNNLMADTARQCHGSRYYLSIKSHRSLSAGDTGTLRSTIRTAAPHPSGAAAAG